MSEVSQVSHLVLAFYESLNKVAQKEQMDVLSYFWLDIEESAKMRYLSQHRAFWGARELKNWCLHLKVPQMDSHDRKFFRYKWTGQT